MKRSINLSLKQIMTKVLMVGSAEQSGGGVASVLRLMKTCRSGRNTSADGSERRFSVDMV